MSGLYTGLGKTKNVNIILQNTQKSQHIFLPWLSWSKLRAAKYWASLHKGGNHCWWSRDSSFRFSHTRNPEQAKHFMLSSLWSLLPFPMGMSLCFSEWELSLNLPGIMHWGTPWDLSILSQLPTCQFIQKAGALFLWSIRLFCSPGTWLYHP